MLNFIFLISILFSACNSQVDKSVHNGQKVEDSTKVTSTQKKESILFWTYDGMKNSIYQNRPVKKDTLNPNGLIKLINKAYDKKVYIQLVKISNDTIYVKIPDSGYLTEQMGTTGATEYMISTTFTLTELSGINYVNFDFEEGDHASPGIRTRKMYLDWIERNKN